MIRFSPSNVRDPDGNRTPRDACAGEHCYCEPGCLIADLVGQGQGGAAVTNQYTRWFSTELTLVTGSSMTLCADAANATDFMGNIHVRVYELIPGFGTWVLELWVGGVQVAADSVSASVTNNYRFTFCTDESGEVVANLRTPTEGAAVAADVTYNNGGFVAWDITNVNTVESWDVQYLQSSLLPTCLPCPPFCETECPDGVPTRIKLTITTATPSTAQACADPWTQGCKTGTSGCAGWNGQEIFLLPEDNPNYAQGTCFQEPDSGNNPAGFGVYCLYRANLPLLGCGYDSAFNTPECNSIEWQVVLVPTGAGLAPNVALIECNGAVPGAAFGTAWAEVQTGNIAPDPQYCTGVWPFGPLDASQFPRVGTAPNGWEGTTCNFNFTIELLYD